MTTDRARRVVGVLLVAVAVAVGGCSSQKDEYKQDARAIINPLREKLNTTSERVSGARSLKQRIMALDEPRRALDPAPAKLEKLAPPADAQTEHEAFVKRLHQ